MHLSVTVRRSEETGELNALIEHLRSASSVKGVTVMEAPSEIDYSYPFPIVAVSEGPNRGRRFGDDALTFLRALSQGM